MTFFSQMSPDITEPIPTPLSSGGNRAAAFAADDRFDCTINGMAFNFRIKKDLEAFWYQRASTTPTKQQIDTNVYAGEASLSDYWIRSQTSWHNGAGVKYYGQGDNEYSDWRYRDSLGIDPWTEGEFSLLHDSERQTFSGDPEPTYISTYVRNGQYDGYVLAYQGDNISYEAEGPINAEGVRTNWCPDPNSQVMTWTGGNGTVTNPSTGGPFGLGYAQKAWTASATWANNWPDSFSTGWDNSAFQVGDLVAVSGYGWHNEPNVPVWGRLDLTFRQGGAEIASVTVQEINSVEDDKWVRFGGVVRVPEAAADADAMRVVFRLNTDTAATNGSIQRCTGFLVEGSEAVNDFFSGATTDADGHDYEWTGSVNASPSTDTYVPSNFHFDVAPGASQPAVVGDIAWFGISGGILRWDMANDIVSTPWTAGNDVKVWWIKGRLFAATGQNLYWVDHTGVGEVGQDGLLVAAGPTPSWRWTDMSQTADAILVAGSDGVKSTVSSITVTDDESGLPVFTGAREVAEMPPGETIRSMFAYLSTYVILATSGGVRVGLVGDSGTVQYGPHTVSLPEGAQDISCRDRFAYVAVTRALPDDTSGVVRIDLSAPIQDTGRYAYAWDVSSETFEDASSVAFWGRTGRVAYGGEGRLTTQYADQYVREGWLDTGRIRYATGEPKDFQKVRLAGEVNGGSATLAGKVRGEEVSVARFNDESGMRNEVSLGLPSGPLFEEVEFRTYLYPKDPDSRTNLARNPRLALSGVGGWNSGTGSFSVSETTQDDTVPTGNGMPVVTATASSDTEDLALIAVDPLNQVDGDYVRITPGIPYTFSIWARLTGTDKTVAFEPWYGTDENTVSAYPVLEDTQTLVGDGTWQRLSVTFTPPVGVAWLGMDVQLTETFLTGEEVSFASVLVEQTDELGDYFDGFGPDSDELRHSWSGTSLASESVQLSVPGAQPVDRINMIETPRTHNGVSGSYLALSTGGGSGTRFLATTGEPTGGGYSGVTWDTAAPTSAPQYLHLTSPAVIPVVPGEFYTFSGYFWRSAGSADVPASMDVTWQDSSFVDIHTAHSEQVSIGEEEWTRVSFTVAAPQELVGTPQNEAAWVTVRMSWNSLPNLNDSFRFASAMMEEGVGLGDYFDGGSTDTATLDHAWTGTDLLSTSTETYVGPAVVSPAYDTPVVESITVKATPAPKKARLVKFPLQCFDFEQNRYGEGVGYDGFTIDRLQELEALDVNHAPVFVVDRRFNEAFTGTIESLEFLSLMNPDGVHDNAGGEFNVTVRVRE